MCTESRQNEHIPLETCNFFSPKQPGKLIHEANAMTYSSLLNVCAKAGDYQPEPQPDQRSDLLEATTTQACRSLAGEDVWLLGAHRGVANFRFFGMKNQ